MSLNSLVKKVEVYERLAVYGDRKSFLESLAQNLPTGAIAFPDELVSSALNSVTGAADNLARVLSQDGKSEELNAVQQISAKLNQAKVASYVTTKEELDAKANPIKTVLQSAASLNMAQATQLNMSEMTQLKNEASRAIEVINIFYRKQGFYTQDASSPEPKASIKAPAKMTDIIKGLSSNLMNKVQKLTTGPQRPVQLKEVDSGVRTLQNYFRQLQKSKNMQDYFARIEIVDTLQKVYNSLQYNDLEAVKSLDTGNKVPDSPESVI